MKTKTIGILGAGGKIGSFVRRTLEPNFNLKLGSRNKKEEDNWFKVDVFDSESLNKFCQNCDVILNCAGPSYLMSEKILKVTSQNKVLYVDVFGGNIKTSKNEKEVKRGEKAVVGVGVYPGLTGILPKYIVEDFDEVENLFGYCGGLEEVSHGAGVDFVLSAISGFGNINSYLEDGKEKIINISMNEIEKSYLPNISEQGILQAFLTNEILELAKERNIKNINWHNAVFDEEIQAEIVNGCNKLLMGINEKDINEIGLKLSKSTKREVEKRGAFYTIGIDVEGVKNNENIKKRAIIKCEDSSSLTAQITALCVEQLANQEIEEGIYWAHQCVDVQKIIKSIEKSDAVDIFEIKEISEDINLGEDEEGVI